MKRFLYDLHPIWACDELTNMEEKCAELGSFQLDRAWHSPDTTRRFTASGVA
jgi:hypothetical protein